MTISREDLERSRREEEYRKFLDEARRKSAARYNESVEGMTAELGKARQKYHQAEHDFKESTHERNRIHSTESVSAIIDSFADSLKAIGGMKAGLIEIVARKAWLNIYKTANNSDAWPKVELNGQEMSILDLIGEGVRAAPRSIGQFIDSRLGTDMEGFFQEPLPPALIPYMAEVNDDGVLRCDLLENEQLHQNDRNEFIQRYQGDFKRAIVRGLREARDVDNQPMYHVDDTTNPDAPVITHAASGEPLTSEEFAEFRETVLTQKLTQEFGEEFRAAGPASLRPGG